MRHLALFVLAVLAVGSATGEKAKKIQESTGNNNHHSVARKKCGVVGPDCVWTADGVISPQHTTKAKSGVLCGRGKTLKTFTLNGKRVSCCEPRRKNYFSH